MKRILIIIVLLLMWSTAMPQDSVTFINKLGEKDKAIFSDAVTLFMYATNKNPQGFTQDFNTLKQAGLLKNMEYDADRTLRRGMLARIVARHMKLTGSFMYLIFGTERYAYTACIDKGLMDADGSEWDPLTGEEVIEVFSRMTEQMEGNQ